MPSAYASSANDTPYILVKALWERRIWPLHIPPFRVEAPNPGLPLSITTTDFPCLAKVRPAERPV